MTLDGPFWTLHNAGRPSVSPATTYCPSRSSVRHCVKEPFSFATGTGYWATPTEVSNVSAMSLRGRPDNATHVAWYRK